MVVSVPVDIIEPLLSVDIMLDESPLIVVVLVDSVFFESQAVARDTTDNTNRADFAKPFMVLVF